MSEPLDCAPRAATSASEDWYADDLGAARFIECTFTDVDFSEATTSRRGVRAAACSPAAASTPRSTSRRPSSPASSGAATSSTRRSRAASCQGSSFAECTLRPITVVGGQWGGVTIRGGNLCQARPHRARPARGRPVDVRPVGVGAARLPARRRQPARHRPGRRRPARRLPRPGRPRGGPAAGARSSTCQGAVLLAELHGADVDVSV